MKNPLTSAEIEPGTFRFVAQHLNHCATAVLPFNCVVVYIPFYVTFVETGRRFRLCCCETALQIVDKYRRALIPLLVHSPGDYLPQLLI